MPSEEIKVFRMNGLVVFFCAVLAALVISANADYPGAGGYGGAGGGAGGQGGGGFGGSMGIGFSAGASGQAGAGGSAGAGGGADGGAGSKLIRTARQAPSGGSPPMPMPSSSGAPNGSPK